MTIDQAVMRMAGVFNLIGLALAYFFSSYWLLLCMFVGLNLIQASFTGFCPAVYLFRKMGIEFGTAFNPK